MTTTSPTLDQDQELAALEAQIHDLLDRASAAALSDDGDPDAILDLMRQAGEHKQRVHQLVSKGQRLRCEQCGCYLPGTPSEQLFTDAGDNLDEYECTHCGEVYEECY